MMGRKAGWMKKANDQQGQRAGKAKQYGEAFKHEYDMLMNAAGAGMDGKPDPFQMTPQQYMPAINKDLNLQQFLTDFPEYKDDQRVNYLKDWLAQMQKEINNPKSFFNSMHHAAQTIKDISSALLNPENKY